MKRFIAVLAVILWLPPVHAHDEPVEQITVSGVGRVQAEPDQVVLSVSVYAVQKDLTTAKSEADQRYQAVLEQAKKAGVEEKDIRVSQLSMYPEYEWTSNERVLRGQRVSRSINIKVRDLTVLPALTQSLVENGISTVDRMTAGFQDESLYKEQAMAEAALDARAKAMFLSEQLDRQLGAAIKIVEQSAQTPVFPYQEMARHSMAADSAAPPKEMLGTQTISATISVSFKLN